MGQRRGRSIDGIVLLDKPTGITSNGALQRVKHLYQARKAGHTGSLDPLASGLLPICLGEATKVSAFLLEADKRYEVTVQLGARTTTGDAEGEIIETRSVAGITEDMVRTVLMRFVGRIQQIPPMHSAIKRNGQPLYKLAHRGLEVKREPREVDIYALELRHCANERLELSVRCSKGTYIRTLAEDIGAALGVGGHVVVLRRTAAGPFDGAHMVSLDALEALGNQGLDALDTLILPMDSALTQWPDVQLSDDMAYYVRQGQAVFVPSAPTSGWVRLRTRDNRFLGLGHVLEDGRVAPRRLVAA